MMHIEIRQQLKALGYASGQVQVCGAGFGRVAVSLDGARIGIYDLHKHTFVD